MIETDYPKYLGINLEVEKCHAKENMETSEA